ncbi:hypothetical protein DM992_25490 [Burkholderia sp. JP2-270]|uniref:ATP-grasp domain-containing protein n=1 Tax=Burkholderia sp. JP2-270 TaxID=2217913 RepID=UPI000DA2DF10|nr:hypothetical protein [Burkholderia sp. JP2-270]AWV02729.1 hypothetical protein DM992_25490 [Burkholderia sp. JP2-270]
MKEHILHIGFHPAFKSFIDFEHANVTVIIHSKLLELYPDELTKFAAVKELKVAHNLNLNEYHNAMDQIESLADELSAAFGKPTAIVGMFEHVTLPAAKLRERYGLAGTKPLIAERFRDKVVMKSALRNSDIRYPWFVAFSDEADIAGKVDELFARSAKVIVKPKSQAAAQGIRVFTDAASCVDYLRELDDVSEVEAEEFIEGRLLHFDGLYENGAFRFFSVSEYFHGCFEVVHEGQHLVSYTIDDPSLFARVQELGLDVIRELGLERGVFHGEVFCTPDDDLVFLEIGNRFGGAGVSPTLKKVFDFDIVAESIRVDLGQASQYAGPTRSIDTGKVGTYVYIALPTTKPCEVEKVNGLSLLPDSVLHHDTPGVGAKLNVAAMPFPASGKFILCNASAEQAQADARSIIRSYSIEVGVIGDA